MSKKTNDILKGVAGFGVALGGASVIADPDVMYAVEFIKIKFGKAGG